MARFADVDDAAVTWAATDEMVADGYRHPRDR
jgi:hypothetical protein